MWRSLFAVSRSISARFAAYGSWPQSYACPPANTAITAQTAALEHCRRKIGAACRLSRQLSVSSINCKTRSLKSSSKQSAIKEEEEEEEDEEADSSSEELSADGRQIIVLALSNRLDLIGIPALGKSRSKFEEACHNGQVRVNGRLPAKMGISLVEGDVVDLLLHPSKLNDRFMEVHRFRLEGTTGIMNNKGKMPFRCRRWSNLAVDDYVADKTPKSR